MSGAEQTDLIAFLSEPAAYAALPDGPFDGPVVRHDTHISAVFLIGPYAFKLKRAVVFPFLDYGDPARRLEMCRREIHRNQAMTPQLYLGVMPVHATADGFRLGGDADGAVDYLVQMRRFAEDDRLDRVCDAGRLTRDLILDAAEEIAQMHELAETVERRRGRDAVAAVLDGLADGLPRHLQEPGLGRRAEALLADARAVSAHFADDLDRRGAAGRIRRGHGDLHLANICLWKGRPRLFDAIEFNDDFIDIDVFYDNAFLLMDLFSRGEAQAASMLLNHLLALSGDHDAMPVLPLFMALRAMIRAEVSAIRRTAMPAGEDARRVQKDIEGYLDFAGACLAPREPRLFAFGGLSGSGKSRLARVLAADLGNPPGAAVLRSDVIRKQMVGVDVDKTAPASAYRQDMSAAVYARMIELAGDLLRRGVTVALDAVFAREAERAKAEKLAREVGVPFQGVWLMAPKSIMAQRIERRRRNVSDATVTVLEKQLAYDLGEIAWTIIDSSGPKKRTETLARRGLGIAAAARR